MGLYQNNNGSLNLLAGSTAYADAPIGAIYPYGGSNAPQGFLICDGTAVSRTTYSALFAVIGTSFGSGDGSTTFNIPDLRGEFLRGAGTNSHSGQGSGGSVGQHQDASAVRPTYVTADNNFWIGSGAAQEMVLNADGQIASANPVVKNTYTASGTGMTSALSVRPTNTSVNFIIKATTIALPSDFEAAVEDAVTDVYGDLIPSSASASNQLVTDAQNNFTYINKSNTVSDLNTLTVPGVYTFTVSSTTTTNAPTTGWLQVYVTRANNDEKYVQQMCVSLGGNLYIRTSKNNNWSAWKQATMT